MQMTLESLNADLKKAWELYTLDMQKIYLDFETYYDVQLSLTKMSTVQYVNHPDFKVWGVGIKVEDGPTEWYNEEETPEILGQIDWAATAVVCHNTLFDAYILTQYYGYQPAFYYDTAAMSRGLYPNMSASLANACKREFPNDETKRKGEELVNAKGVRDLDPELDAQIGGYCIQDVDLTYELFQSYIRNISGQRDTHHRSHCTYVCRAKAYAGPRIY